MTNVNHDSREKLEVDVRIWCRVMGMQPYQIDFIYDWLNRQAAITRAECDKPNWEYCDTCEKVDELEAELNRTCTLEYDGKWLVCSNCGESLQWFGVRTVYKTDGKQERALGVEGVRYCPFCGAMIAEGDTHDTITMVDADGEAVG